MLDPKIKLLEFHNHKKSDKYSYIIKKILKYFNRTIKIGLSFLKCKHCKKIISETKKVYLKKQKEKLNELEENQYFRDNIVPIFQRHLLKDHSHEICEIRREIEEIDLNISYLNQIKEKLCRKCKKNFNKFFINRNHYYKYFSLLNLLYKEDKKLNKEIEQYCKNK